MLTHVRLAVSGGLLSSALRWVESDHDDAGVSPAVSASRVLSRYKAIVAFQSHAAASSPVMGSEACVRRASGIPACPPPATSPIETS